MKSIVELLIHAPQAEVAALFADPHHNPRWMDEIERIEPVHGEPGEPGSVYRLAPKDGKDPFVATVRARHLPDRVELELERADLSVAIVVKLVRLAEDETQLISEETFTFEGVPARILGFFALSAIKRAHRQHMEAFKRFAELPSSARAVSRLQDASLFSTPGR